MLWLRNDLRLRDHPALTAAAADAERLLIVYCFDPRSDIENVPGLARRGPRRQRFLAEALSSLRDGLRALGNELMLCHGLPETMLPELAERHGVTRVHVHGEIGTEEQAAEQAVARALASHGATLARHWTRTLYHPDDLPFALADMPRVFSPFRRKVEKHAAIRPPLPAPGALPPAPTDGDFGEIVAGEPVRIDKRAVLAFRGGEQEAWARVQGWIWERDHLRRYRDTRNGLLGADYSSKLSPWLALGCISARDVADQVALYEQQRTANRSTYWLVFELLWRDFFSFTALACGADLFRPTGPRGEPVTWRRDDAAFARWCEGRTGIPFVDANMRELAQTGYMSNRGRQNVASFLSGYLGLDWRLGAAWFEHALLDHDVGSNWGNWAWNSGVGFDPRQRVFNVLGQAERYDRDGEYVRTWIPELAGVDGAMIHAPWHLSAASRQAQGAAEYPAPMIDAEASISPPWGEG